MNRGELNTCRVRAQTEGGDVETEAGIPAAPSAPSVRPRPPRPPLAPFLLCAGDIDDEPGD